jgi:hypothetical protein
MFLWKELMSWWQIKKVEGLGLNSLNLKIAD